MSDNVLALDDSFLPMTEPKDINQWLKTFFNVLPKNQLSHITGKLVSLKLPGPIGNLTTKSFANFYKINLDEAELPVEQYKSISELFTRKLKAGVRPIKGEVVHPADSQITEEGVISEGVLVQAKGKTYTIADLLKLPDVAAQFRNGYFATYYLCPTDYHRVHSPVSGEIVGSHLIPGQLWPVNSWSVNNVRDLFAVNERVVTLIKTSKGVVAVVMVGATNVGQITMSYDSQIKSNSSLSLNRKDEHRSYSPSIKIQAGDELGVFHMGSTVIMVYPPDFFGKDFRMRRGYVKMGESVQS
jgi:phosphatidylserine decarboxylase